MTIKTLLIFSFLLFLSPACLEKTSKIALKGAVAATRGSNAGLDGCRGMIVDSSGNIYCAGSTTGSMGEANGGSNDAFIMKFNSSGALQWVTQLGAVTVGAGGSNARSDSCLSMTIDRDGNVYCAGHTTSSMGEPNGGSSDAIIIKVNSSGTLQWIKQLGAVTFGAGGSNTGSDMCYGITTDRLDNIYCSGRTDGSMGEANGGSYDAFILKLNSSGALQWVKQLGAVTIDPGGSNGGSDACRSVIVDGSDNIYCAGNTIAMGEANGGSNDAFVMKLNSSGTLQWVTQLGAVTVDAGGNNIGSDVCSAMTFDSFDNVYCAGETTGAVGEASGGSSDPFIFKLNSSGALQWVTQLGAITTATGGSNVGYGGFSGAFVDSSNNVYCSGATQGSLGETNSGGYDAFILKLNSSGALQWVTQLGASTIAPGGSNTGFDSCFSIFIDSGDDVYCAGETTGAIGEANGGDSDAFIMKLDQSGALQWVKQLGAVTSAIL